MPATTAATNAPFRHYLMSEKTRSCAAEVTLEELLDKLPPIRLEKNYPDSMIHLAIRSATNPESIRKTLLNLVLDGKPPNAQ